MDKSETQDPIKLLIDWVVQHGGEHNVVVKEDKNGVRGLYASRSFNMPYNTQQQQNNNTFNELNQIIVKIPNKLMVSSYHVKHQIANSYFKKVREGDTFSGVKYQEIFQAIPELFDPKFKYSQNSNVRSRIDNEYAEYFQLTFFLINERLKGKHSFWYPFINYLPDDIQTLYTYPDNTPIHEGAQTTLIDTIQIHEDDLHQKISYDRLIHLQNKERFLSLLNQHKEDINNMLGLQSEQQQQEYWEKVNGQNGILFEWAWMNVGTRCFGTYHIPGDIAMMPLLDLMNHSIGEDKLTYFIQPINLNIKMLERYDTVRINKELELDYQAEMPDFEDYDATLEWESQDFDQHYDDYGDRYYNYLPKPKQEPKKHDSDSEEEKDEDKFIQQDPLEKIWDLQNDKIFFGKKLMNKDKTQIEEGEELHLCYGERSNSFLLIEYGFTLPDNRYDFVRIDNISLNILTDILNKINHNNHDVEINTDSFKNICVEKYKIKDNIRVDLKYSGLHRDLVRFIRCLYIKNKDEKFTLQQEKQALEVYKQICQDRLDKYPTSLIEDKQHLQDVQQRKDNINYHWMYQYVLIYRIGQKEILERQIRYCTKIQEAFDICENNFEKLKDLLKQIADTNSMSDYIDEIRTTLDFDNVHE